MSLERKSPREEVEITVGYRGLGGQPDRLEKRTVKTAEGDTPPWRPLRAFDDGRQVFIAFPSGIGQGEMPPLWVIGPAGGAELVNYRIQGNHMVVDRLFAAAELRLGGETQKKVRIVRTDGRPQS